MMSNSLPPPHVKKKRWGEVDKLCRSYVRQVALNRRRSAGIESMITQKALEACFGPEVLDWVISVTGKGE